MRSEVRRAAAALVATREERFATNRAPDEARERLDAALTGVYLTHVDVQREWTGGEKPELVVRLTPVRAIKHRLQAASLLLVVFIAASLWVISSEAVPRAIAFLVPLATGLMVLALPLASAALGSLREGEEARLRKVIRTALADES